MAECIVHFEVHENGGEVSKLRGLVMIEPGKKPTVEEVQDMLQMMGYPVKIDDKERYEYVPATSGVDWNKIIVKKMDTGEETFTPDMQLKALAESMMQRNSRSI
ncbi:dipeptidyl aminopeptidase [Paenibacillus marinisediminis]